MKEYSVKYSISLLENYNFSNVLHGGKHDKEGKINNFFLQLVVLDTSTKKPSALCFLEDKSPPWTKARTNDELYLQLVSLKINGERKYEKQASYLIYRIPVYDPTPYFIINQSDLSKPLIKELSCLSNKERDKIVKDVLSALYESIDKKYFLLCIKKRDLIRWRIVP
jgi:hypothetical protein